MTPLRAYYLPDLETAQPLNTQIFSVVRRARSRDRKVDNTRSYPCRDAMLPSITGPDSACDRIFWDKGTQRYFFDERKSTLREEDATAEKAMQTDWSRTEMSPAGGTYHVSEM